MKGRVYVVLFTVTISVLLGNCQPLCRFSNRYSQTENNTLQHGEGGEKRHDLPIYSGTLLSGFIFPDTMQWNIQGGDNMTQQQQTSA